MKQIDQAILKTFVYADVFDYPLTLDEIHRYLISPQPTKPPTNAQVLQVANTFKGFYFLPNRHKLVSLRQHRQRDSQSKLYKANTLAQSFAHLPSILGVFITGNLAMNNADETDDIDVLIITQANRLWSTRLKINFYTDWHGLRRRPIKKTPRLSQTSSDIKFRDKLCLNMWLDETALALPKNKRNLYTAHEVIQVKPIINKNKIYERFLSANSWVLDYLPNSNIPNSGLSPNPKSQIPKPNIFESLSFHLQHAYMKRKMSRETVYPHAAFFHPRDTTNTVLKLYQQRLTQIIK